MGKKKRSKFHRHKSKFYRKKEQKTYERRKKNNLGHPTLPLYSITYLLHTKTGNFWHILPIVAKNCVCQEISSKSNRRRRFYTTKHVNFFGLSEKFVLRISCYHLTSFSSFYLCLSISVSAYFLV